LHTYGGIYPAGLRRPELVPAGTQTAFRLYEKLFSWEEERESQTKLGMCIRVRDEEMAALTSSIYRKPKG
jgi:hypothetical protein